MSNYPGYGTTLTNDPTAILASGHGYIVINVTIKSGEGELEKGQVLGVETASTKYVKYDSGAGDGSEVAKAILADKVDASSSDILVAAYIRGAFVKSKLADYDAAALVDLNGRLIGIEGGADTDIVLI